MKRTPIYGMMAEFDSPTLLVEAAHRTHDAGYLKIDAYSPFPVEGLAEAIGLSQEPRPVSRADWRTTRRFIRLRPAVLDLGNQLSDQCGRQTLSFVAGVYRGDFRDDHFVRRHFCRVWDAGVEWPAHAIPSRFQCAALRVRDQRSLLSDRVFYRSQVQPERNPPVS